MGKITPNQDLVAYFKNPSSPMHKQYLALRRFFVDGYTADQVAAESGYAVGTIYAMVRDFKADLRNEKDDPFFKAKKIGRKPIDQKGEIETLIVGFRKKYLSVPDIKIALDSMGINVSEGYIYETIHNAGFAKLPRRDKELKHAMVSISSANMKAPVAHRLEFKPETFSSQLAGLLCLLPFIVNHGIDKAIEESSYPQTKELSRISSILSFVALKSSSVKRYSSDDTWCMDRGMGLFAGLNVLPKAAWFSSYSSAITRNTNISFLKRLHTIWLESGLLSDTANLDFTAIPFWGDDEPFENNWSGKRAKALASIQAAIAQDPQSGILCYGDTTVRHRNQDDVVLEFLDFYHSDPEKNSNLKYLVFDSKFTTYQNLNKLNQKDIKFLTIRRRGKQLVEKIDAIPASSWKRVKVKKANGKSRSVLACEETVKMKGYDDPIRQIYIKGNGKIKPAIIITNEFDLPMAAIIQKYSNRWLVETEIAEHIDFFHLNRNSSGIVIKVDFDLTMSILAHNIYRLFAMGFEGYSHCNAQTIFDKFITVQGEIEVGPSTILVKLKKKRTLPLILEQMATYDEQTFPWINGMSIKFAADSTT